MKKFLLTTIVFFGLITFTTAQTKPEVAVCDFGITHLKAQLHNPRLVNNNSIFATIDIEDSIEKINQLIITIQLSKKTRNIALLKKSLIDQNKITKNEVVFDTLNNRIIITKNGLAHQQDVATHSLQLYMNKKISTAFISVMIIAGNKRYHSEIFTTKTI